MPTVQSTPEHPPRLVPLQESIFGASSLLLPGILFLAALIVVSGQAGYPRLLEFSTHPWELWVIGVCGLAATVGGLLDLHYHVAGRRVVGRRERHGELLALGLGGIPTFVMMLTASIIDRPERLLLPITGTVIFTTAMVCYDEFVFHRRTCTRYETALHRTLVFGNALAWAAWMHWIYVRA